MEKSLAVPNFVEDNQSYQFHMCDGHLEFPGFSAVFIHTFSFHHTRRFFLPQEYSEPKNEGPFKSIKVEGKDVFLERADYLKYPIAKASRDIEHMIFILHADKDEEIRNVRRFSLRGFDFTMPLFENIEDEKDKDKNGKPKTKWVERMTLSGHCNVEMSLFFGHAVSITYRFLFDGNTATLSKPACTDDLIAFLSTWLGAEYWSRDKGTDAEGAASDINFESEFHIKDFHFDEDGNYLEEGFDIDMKAKGRYFDGIALRYKKYLYGNCTRFKEDVSKKEKDSFKFPQYVENDLHYAMVDLWENIRHPEEDGSDLFDPKRKNPLTEAQIINHIREEHKSELIGLLTLYPGEWPYRDPEAYDEVCGENIAIDTDDLVLCGSSLCMVLGTYTRRGSESSGVDWKQYEEERAHDHVLWPEYLVILQMVLAKKYLIGYVRDRLIESSADMMSKSPTKIIKENAELSVRLSRIILRLDVVKMSKFPSHKVMYDRTSRRLGLDEDMESLNTLMDTLDRSLGNISDAKSAQSESMLNLILGFISIASAFQLFFSEMKMPFITKIFKLENTEALSAATVAAVAGLAIFAILYLMVHLVKDSWTGNNSKK